MFEPIDAPEFAGHYVADAIKQMVDNKSFAMKICFYGGRAEDVNTFTDECGKFKYEQIVDRFMFHEPADVEYGALISRAEFKGQNVILVETFDYVIEDGMRTAISIPYEAKKILRPLKIYDPFFVESWGSMQDNMVWEFLSVHQLGIGMTSHPEFNTIRKHLKGERLDYSFKAAEERNQL